MEKDYSYDLFAKAKLLEDKELKLMIYKILMERNELLDSLVVDNLTTVYNRTILGKIKDYTVVVMLDVDDFKHINDNYGHDVGDKILRIVAKSLVSHFRLDDIICRFGGDEFIIVFNDCPLEVIEERMRNVQNSLLDPFRDGKMSVSLSVGISERKEGQNLKDNLKEADIALYHSKGLKNNSISINNISVYDGEAITKVLK